MKYLKDIPDLKNKKVLMRTDFDVPVSEDGKILETFRIKRQKSTIDYLIENEAKVVMMAHVSKTRSFKNLILQLEKILGHSIKFVENVDGLKSKVKSLNRKNIILLEHIRKFDGELRNDKEFARKLSEDFDLYINNNFATLHRNHASISSMANFLSSYAGFLLENEINNLKKVINHPNEGKIFIIGGAKTVSKLRAVKNLINKAEKILLGGIVANDILKERGIDIGLSEADENTEELLKGLDINDSRLILPEDFNISDNKFHDIGEKSIDKFKEHIKKAKMIVWSGPLGYYENPEYAIGTNKIAVAISKSSSFKVIGGGDTVTAVDRIGLLDRFDFISTGGGAMLEFLAGNKLPGLKALGYYQK